ncbi:MAG: TRAM domain-containing protein [Candidatus Woesearchaeota archaeon]
MFERRQVSPPVNQGEELEVTIESIGEKGDGLAKVNGFVLFIPDVKQGERVKVKVTKVLQKLGFAEVVGRIEGSMADDSKPEKVQKAKPVEEEVQFDESKFSEDFGEEEK